MKTSFRSPQAGLSLIELMVAMTIGLLIFAGLATLFSNASSSQHELRRTSQQIENGRYAMDVLIQDLQLAGYFGEFRAAGDQSVQHLRRRARQRHHAAAPGLPRSLADGPAGPEQLVRRLAR